MTGIRTEFSFNDSALRRELRERLRRLEDTEPLLKSIGEEMLPRINERFKEERGPDGNSWAPLAARTIRARSKRHGNSPLTILRMRGHLAGSLNYQVSGDSLKIGTGGEVEAYAAIHQFGGQAGKNHKVTIKARPYLGFADDDMAVIEEEVAGFLAGE